MEVLSEESKTVTSNVKSHGDPHLYDFMISNMNKISDVEMRLRQEKADKIG